jgi:imidazolonepropionase-like amidohydrolase
MAFALDGGLWVLPVTPDGQPDGSLKRVVDEAVDFLSWYPDSESLIYLASGSMKKVALGSLTPEEIPVHLEIQVPANSAKMLIRGARLIDGTGAPARDDVDILIEGNRIQSVESGIVPEGDVRVIDATGKTVLPGLIESHTHLSLPAWGSRHGKVWLAYGVTSIRTASAPLFRVLEEKESILAGLRTGPRIFFTGFSLDGDRVYYPGSLSIESEEELDRELDRAFGLDFDLIKTYVRFPDALQKKVVSRAHDHGIPVTSHELFPAVAYGVDGIEHIWGTSRRGFSPKVTELRRSYQDVVELISKSGVFFTPTILIMGGFEAVREREPELLLDARHSDLYPSWARFQGSSTPASESEDGHEILSPYLDTIDRIVRGGGNVLAGTDSPIVPYGLGLILEIELLSDAGLGPLEAIRSSTQLAARALGAENDLGTVEPGKLADLVILSKDPSQDIKNLRTTQMVVLNGRLVTLRQLLRSSLR